MSTRRTAALARRKAHHEAQIAKAATLDGRLWRVCAWLIVEARRADRVVDATRFLLDVIEHVRTDTFDPGPWRLFARLVAEARKAGRSADLTRLVITVTDQIRQESAHARDRH